MTTISQATPEDFLAVRQLFWEYLQWLNDMLNQAFRFSFDIATAVEQNMDDIAIFLPPKGRLLLAIEDSGVAGCACMRTIGPALAEVKRVYIRPGHRRNGLGRALVQALILELQQTGYTRLRLDTGFFMPEAQKLYRSLGFEEIAPYPESEVPQDIRKHFVFMELLL